MDEERKRSHAEEAAELSLMALAFSQGPVPTLIIDERGAVRAANEGAARLCRRPVPELIGLQFGEALDCVLASSGCTNAPQCAGCPLHMRLRSTLDTGKPAGMFELVEPFQRPEVLDQLRTVASTSRVMIGGLTRIVATFHQLSPQDRPLDDTPDLVTVTNALAEALFTVRLPERTIEYVNRAAEELFGIPAKEMIGQPTTILYPSPAYAKAFGTKLAAAMVAGEPQLRTEHEFARRGGETFWGAVSTTFLRQGDQLSRVISVLTDISDRKRIEQELRASEARYRAIFDRAPVGIVLFELETGRCRTVNERYCEIIEYSRAQAMGQSFFAVTHPDDVRIDHRAREALRRSPRDAVEHEKRLLRPSGEIIYVRTVLLLLGDGEEKGLVMAIVQDITERRRLDKEKTRIAESLRERQKLDSLGMLAGGVAHDLNNILTAVTLNMALLQQLVASNDQAQRKIDRIRDATTRAAELTQQLLAYAGQGRVVVERLNLSEVVSGMDELLRSSVSKATQLELSLEPFAIIEADATQLRQIIMNLVINASQALPDEGGKVRVTVAERELREVKALTVFPGRPLSPGYYSVLEVVDDGRGIEPDRIGKIFDPFFTTKAKGHGLGLSAILGIANAHGGGVQVESTLGEGTAFRVLLPVAEGDPTAEPNGASVEDEWQGSGRALVVDDEQIVRTATCEMLMYLGYEVDEAADGQEALDKISSASGSYSFVLLDLTMPVMDGLATLERLRELDPDVPVVLVSGFSKQELSERHGQAGFAAFIHKPYDLHELTQVLQAIERPS